MNNKFLFDQLFGSPVCEGDANSLHRKQDVPTLTIFLEEGGGRVELGAFLCLKSFDM